MRSRALILLGLSGVLLGVAYVGRKLPPEPDFLWKAKGETTGTSTKCFPTGLLLSVQQRPGMDVVAVTTTLGVGARRRDLGGGEGAHLLEHLWFQSTPRGSIVWDELEAMGAVFNATTAADVTFYYTSVPKQELKSLLDLEMARLADPLVGVDQAIVDREAAVVASEARLRGIRHWVFSPSVNDALFPEGHIYHGAARTVQVPDLASLTELGADYAHPNASVLVVGDVSPSQVQELLLEVEPALSEVFEGDQVDCLSGVGVPSAPPDPGSNQAGPVQGRYAAPGFGVAWTLPGAWEGQDALAIYTAAVLERSIETIRAERFYGKELRSRNFDTMHQCHVIQQQYGSVLVCEIYGRGWGLGGTLSENFMENARADVELALARVAASPDEQIFVSDLERRDRETTRIKLMNGLRAMGDATSPLYSSSAPFIHHHFQGRHDYAASNLDALYEVTQEQVVEFAQSYLTPERMVRLQFTPAIGSVASQAERPDTGPERTSLPLKAGLSQVASLPEAVEGRTSGGLRVLVLERAYSSQVKVRLRFLGPSSQEPKPWVDQLVRYSTSFTKDPWVGGTTEKARGVGIGVWRGRDLAGPYWQLSGSAENLEEILYLMRAITLQFKTDAGSATAAEVDHIGTHLRTSRTTLMDAVLFPGTPMGERAGKDPAAWGTVIKRRINGIYHAGNATLEIVGGVESQEALELSERYLGEWQARETRSNAVAFSSPELPPRTIQWRDRPWTSASVRYSCRLQDVEQADPAAQAVLLRRFQDELLLALRHDSGMTYAPRAWLQRLPQGPSTLNAEIEIDPASVGALTAALLSVSDGLPGSDSQVEATRAGLVAQSPNHLVTLHQSLYYLDQKVLFGEDFYQRWATGLLTVKAKDLKMELASCQGHEVVFIEGMGEQMSGSIARAKLGAEELESPQNPYENWLREQNKKLEKQNE